MFHLLVIIFLSFLVFRNIAAISRIKQTTDFLFGHFRFKMNFSCAIFPKIIILLPVFREIKTVESAIKYFSSLYHPKKQVDILVITTEKETKFDQNITTLSTIKKLLTKYDNLRLLHYPHAKGNKADQINYAVDKLNFVYPEIDSKNTFLAIYDIDSRPNRYTLEMFFQFLKNNPLANIFQQSAIFLKNYKKHKGNLFSRLLLKAAAIEQTRFTLAHEIPRMKRECEYCITGSGLLNSITYAHCVGHGLFIRASYLKKIRLPENYYPEDMFYGFIISSLKEPLVSLPILDNSEMPDTIQSLFLQRSKWFLGPFLGLKYCRYVKKKYNNIYKKDKIRILSIAIYATLLGVKWAISSLIVLLLLFLLLFGDLIIRSLVILFFLSYVFSFYLILINFENLGKIASNKKNKPRFFERVIVSLFGIFYLFFHGIPADYTLIKILAKKILKSDGYVL